MSRVVSVIIDTDEGSVDRRVTFTITFEDNDLIISTETIGPIVVGENDDINAIALSRANQLLDKFMAMENEALVDIDVSYATVNPLTFANNPSWSTTKEIAKKLLRWMIRERDPRIVIFLEPLIVYLQANYSASQMANFLDLTIEQIININVRVNAILTNVGTVKAQLLVFDDTREDID